MYMYIFYEKQSMSNVREYVVSLSITTIEICYAKQTPKSVAFHITHLSDKSLKRLSEGL